MQTIRLVDKEGGDMDVIRGLFREYAAELQEDLCFQSFEEEVTNPLKKYGEPAGCILLAYIDDVPAGCIALMPLPAAGTCEMKRLYVRPAYRKSGLGRSSLPASLPSPKKKDMKKCSLTRCNASGPPSACTNASALHIQDHTILTRLQMWCIWRKRCEDYVRYIAAACANAPISKPPYSSPVE